MSKSIAVVSLIAFVLGTFPATAFAAEKNVSEIDWQSETAVTIPSNTPTAVTPAASVSCPSNTANKCTFKIQFMGAFAGANGTTGNLVRICPFVDNNVVSSDCFNFAGETLVDGQPQIIPQTAFKSGVTVGMHSVQIKAILVHGGSAIFRSLFVTVQEP